MTNINLNEIVDKTYKKQNVAIDATLLTAIMSCPRYTDLRFNNNLIQIGGKSNSLEIGSLVHTFLENYYGSIIKGLDKSKAVGQAFASAELYIRGCLYCSNFIPTHIPNPDESLDDHHCNEYCIIKPTCGHQVNQYEGMKNTPKEIDKSNPKEKSKIGWQWALDTCDQYIKFYASDFWVPLFVEEVKGKILYEDEEIRILWKAKLDLGVDTNNGIYPVDHKTMKQNRSQLNLNNQFTGQCLIMGTRSMIINKIGFQSTLEPKEKFLREMVNYSVPRLLEWQREILPYYAKLLVMYSENGYFPPQYDHCEGKYGKCSFHEICAADPLMREDLLKQNFIVGPIWNPSNETIEE
jgi:hypothetical protein